MICYFQLASDVFSIGVLVTVCFGIANDIWRFKHCKVIRISWIIQIPQENTLQQHLKTLEKLKKILKHPMKILVHCGCNDLDNFEVLEVMKDTEEPIKYQNTQIIISSLFPRTERNLWETINQINDFLKRAQQNVNVKFMNNHSIKSKMMRDNKLVNKTGLFIFFANIRFILYGSIPKFIGMTNNQVYNKRQYTWILIRSATVILGKTKLEEMQRSEPYFPTWINLVLLVIIIFKVIQHGNQYYSVSSFFAISFFYYYYYYY